ncbi:MAG: transposase [Kofleriaceae bacterium]
MPVLGLATFFGRGKLQHTDLRGALVREARRLASGRSHVAVPATVGVDFTRAKVEPMVRALFTRGEHDIVLGTFEKSVAYVTSVSIEPILLGHMWDRSAWDLANMDLLSVGAKLLGKKAARIVGMSEETTLCAAELLRPKPARIPSRRVLRRGQARRQHEVVEDSVATVVPAPPPETLFPKALLHTSTIAHILTSKFALGVPHYRLERDLLDQDMRLDRGLMSGYVEHAGNTLGATVVTAMWRDAIANGQMISTDATGALIQLTKAKAKDGRVARV